jgi:hypothetical protein
MFRMDLEESSTDTHDCVRSVGTSEFPDEAVVESEVGWTPKSMVRQGWTGVLFDLPGRYFSTSQMSLFALPDVIF